MSFERREISLFFSFLRLIHWLNWWWDSGGSTNCLCFHNHDGTTLYCSAPASQFFATVCSEAIRNSWSFVILNLYHKRYLWINTSLCVCLGFSKKKDERFISRMVSRKDKLLINFRQAMRWWRSHMEAIDLAQDPSLLLLLERMWSLRRCLVCRLWQPGKKKLFVSKGKLDFLLWPFSLTLMVSGFRFRFPKVFFLFSSSSPRQLIPQYNAHATQSVYNLHYIYMIPHI